MNPGDTTIEEKPLVTDAEHEQGFKHLEVLKRNGSRTMMRINAVDAFKAQTILPEMIATNSTLPLLAAALDAENLRLIQKLDMTSIQEVQAVAGELAFGRETQKKMEQMSKALLAAMCSTASAAPGSTSSAPDSTPPKSGAGACPGSEPGSPSPTSSNSTI